MNTYELIGIFIVSPLWGVLSPYLFLRGWLSFLGILATFVFLFQARRQYRAFLFLFCAHITYMLFTFTLLIAGFYIFYFHLPFGKNDLETLVYWLFSTLAMAFILPKVSIRIDQMLEQAKAISSSAEWP
jgi:hypothetical protein